MHTFGWIEFNWESDDHHWKCIISFAKTKNDEKSASRFDESLWMITLNADNKWKIKKKKDDLKTGANCDLLLSSVFLSIDKISAKKLNNWRFSLFFLRLPICFFSRFILFASVINLRVYRESACAFVIFILLSVILSSRFVSQHPIADRFVTVKDCTKLKFSTVQMWKLSTKIEKKKNKQTSYHFEIINYKNKLAINYTFEEKTTRKRHKEKINKPKLFLRRTTD